MSRSETLRLVSEEDFSVSAMIGATLAGIAYSTTRGIILDCTQSTDFKGVLLPVINPQQLLLKILIPKCENLSTTATCDKPE